MIRYERTGEFRYPARGEWVECDGCPWEAGDDGPRKWAERRFFILRRVEAPAGETAVDRERLDPFIGLVDPAPAPRPGTEQILVTLMCVQEAGRFDPRDLREIERRVRAWETAREYVANCTGRGLEATQLCMELLAILDGKESP